MELYRAYNRLAPTKMGYIFSIIGFGMLFAIVSMEIVTPLLQLVIKDEAYLLFSSQILVSLLTILLPAWLTEKYFRRKNFTHLFRLDFSELSSRNILMVGILMLCTVPITVFSTYLMELVPIPSFMQVFIEQSEKLVGDTYDLFLTEKRPLGMLLSCISIVIIAPITEEYLFRGALQGWLLSKVKNVHVVVWVVAFIFSMIHVQWSGLLARLILGAMLGYTALYGGIWLSVLLHLLNNLTVYTLSQITGKEDYEEISAGPEIIFYLVLTGLATFIAYKVYMRLKKENVKTLDAFSDVEEEENNYED